MAFSFGVSPICDRRSIAEHPLATLPTASSAPMRMIRWRLDLVADVKLDFKPDLDMNITRLEFAKRSTWRRRRGRGRALLRERSRRWCRWRQGEGFRPGARAGPWPARWRTPC